jgi:nicotinate-nucleotide pyrophosphorylase (carboxylating)
VVEVEVTTLDELDEALEAGATLILLDNFSVAGLHNAVARARGRARLEASGGITLGNLSEVARTGVDFISLGALTHSAGVLDFSLDVVS